MKILGENPKSEALLVNRIMGIERFFLSKVDLHDYGVLLANHVAHIWI